VVFDSFLFPLLHHNVPQQKLPTEWLDSLFSRIFTWIQTVIDVEGGMAPYVWYLVKRPGGGFNFFPSHKSSHRCHYIIFTCSSTVKWLPGLDIISRSVRNFWYPPSTWKPGVRYTWELSWRWSIWVPPKGGEAATVTCRVQGQGDNFETWGFVYGKQNREYSYY